MLALLAVASGHSLASGIDVANVGIRARIGETRVLGKEQLESFHEYDVTSTMRVPWQVRTSSGWGVGVALNAAAGAIEGADKVAMVVSAIPVIVLGSRDGRYVLDAGLGVALLSKHHFAQQDYGGPLQAALTIGLEVPLYGRLGGGYRFLHYSDAGAYGGSTIGADFHMLELLYRF